MATVRSDAATLRVLLDLQSDLALELDLDRVLERIARAACDVLRADRATIYVVDELRNELWSKVLIGHDMREIRLPIGGTGLAAEVGRSGQTIRIANAYEDRRFNAEFDARSGYRTRTLLVAPIDSRDAKRLGVLQVVNKLEGEFGEIDEAIARALAASAGIALEHAQLHGELQEERLRVVRIAEETRHRLARDLHDTVAQTLANTAVGIEVAVRRAPEDLDATLAELGQLRGRVVDAQRSLRDILFSLRPVVLETGGLGDAARALAQRLDGTRGVRVEAGRVATSHRLRPEVEAGAFAIMQEAANNAIKHGARRVVLETYEDEGETVVRVEDDGPGFDIAGVLATYAERGSLGLLQLREGARLIGGRLILDSTPGHGTRVILRVPGEGGAKAA